MKLQSKRRRRVHSPRRGIVRLSLKILALPLLWAITASGAKATTIIDPDPESSSTLFGHTILPIGDITGDGIPDLAIAAPYQDGDFVSITMSYGNPQNVGKVFIVDGANFAILNDLTDPEFDLVQDQHFGGQLGTSLAAVGDLDGD